MEPNTIDNAWDSLCTNPHEEIMEEGRQQGRVDGKRDGLKEGFTIGHTTALEYGMEIGFIRGVASMLASRWSSFVEGDSRSPAIEKSLENLQVALAAFPDPDQLLSVEEARSRIVMRDQSNDSEEVVDDTGDGSSLDVVGKMQRIRARFKVLVVQLGVPAMSLKSTMDEDSKSGETSEW